jgi:predicted nucleotide-binding protein (sugar kinase/HSP70/actin superfamily)
MILERRGTGDVLLLSPSAVNAYQGLPAELRRMVWDCVLLSDIVHKVEMGVRPYEPEPGAADEEVARAVREVAEEFGRGGRDLPGALRRVLPRVSALKKGTRPRPRVGVVGEIYVRNNPFINDDLVRTIERLGGEVRVSSLAEWMLYTDYLHRHGIGPEKRTFQDRLTAPLREHFLSAKEELYYGIAGPYLGDRAEPPVERIIEVGRKWVPIEFQGEAILTIGRAVLMIEEERCGMVVNASPAFCMPGTITSAIFPQVERELSVPILSLFYEGSGDPNRALIPHLHYLARTGSDALAR